MIKFRNFAIASTVAVLTAFTFTAKANAQSARVDFNGAIPASCSINSVTPGTLTVMSPTTLKSGYENPTGGVPGNINVTCANGVLFTFTSIGDNGGTINYNAIDSVNAAVYDGTTRLLESSTSPSGASYLNGVPVGTASTLQAGPITNKNYAIGLHVYSITGALPQGTYKIRAVVALTPQ